MQINFDLLATEQCLTFNMGAPSVAEPISLEIESPVKHRVSANLSAYTFKQEIEGIRSLIDLPDDASEFIVKQIVKELSAEKKDANANAKANKTYFSNSDKMPNALAQTIKKNAKTQGNVTETMKKGKRSDEQKKVKPKCDTSWVFNYKKHSRKAQPDTRWLSELGIDQEVTGKPQILDCKENRKIDKKRKLQTCLSGKAEPFSVHQNLFAEAIRRKMKLQVEREFQEKQRQKAKPKTNPNYFTKRDSVYVPLTNRVNDILGERLRRSKQKENLDLTSGREMFKPDLSLSRKSYNIYLHSLSKEKPSSRDLDISVEFQSKQKSKKRESNKKRIVKDEQCFLKVNKHKNNEKQVQIDAKTVNFITEVFYQSQSENTQSKHKILSAAALNVLENFLHELEEMQMKKFEQETTVSSAKDSSPSKGFSFLSKEDFRMRLKAYFKKLTLYDRQILRSLVKRTKRSKQRDEEELNYCPKISIRSSSLDNLHQGHSHQIYFI